LKKAHEKSAYKKRVKKALIKSVYESACRKRL